MRHVMEKHRVWCKHKMRKGHRNLQRGSRPAQANSSQDPVLKKPITKKGLCTKSTCLASMRPWIHTPVLTKTNKNPSRQFKIFFRKNIFHVCVCVFASGVWTQDFTLARQVLYHLAMTWAKCYFYLFIYLVLEIEPRLLLILSSCSYHWAIPLPLISTF
jgi:hypothetical protein